MYAQYLQCNHLSMHSAHFIFLGIYPEQLRTKLASYLSVHSKKLVQPVKLFRQPTGLRSITATELRKAGGHGRLAIDRCLLCKQLLWFKVLLPTAIDCCLSEEAYCSHYCTGERVAKPAVLLKQFK